MAPLRTLPDPGTASLPTLALCLSGGGFRATFFHLGALRFLRETGLLTRVVWIGSVSGGSIIAAHLAVNWAKYTGPLSDFDSAASELITLGSRDLRGRVVRRWLLSFLLPFLRFLGGGRWRLSALLEGQYSKLFRGATLKSLAGAKGEPKPPIVHLLSTSMTTGHLCSFTREGYHIDDGLSEKLLPTGLVPLALAVAASSAFPPLFPPVKLSRKMLDAPVSALPYDPEYLSDGGIFDNLGIRKLFRLYSRHQLDADFVLISDAGGAFDWEVGSPFSWIVSRTVRATDILMKRISDFEEESVRNESSSLTGRFISCSIAEVVAASDHDAVLDEDLQRKARLIRTDFDKFSRLEIGALIQHGYAVAQKVCRKAFADHQIMLPLSDGTDGIWDPVSSLQELRKTQQAAKRLEEARKRSIGIWDPRDPASWAVALIVCLVLGSPLAWLAWRQVKLDRSFGNLTAQRQGYMILSGPEVQRYVISYLRQGPRTPDALVDQLLRDAGFSLDDTNRLLVRAQLSILANEKMIEVIPEGADAGSLKLVTPPSDPVVSAPGYVSVRTYYATNRRRSGSAIPARYFGNERDDLQWGTAEVSIPKSHRLGALESPSLVSFWSASAERHVLIQRILTLDDARFLDELRVRVGQLATKRVLVVVHGYNVSFDDFIRQAAQIAYDLAFDGAVVPFSWPSQASVGAYLQDEATVEWAAPALGTLLAQMVGQSGAQRVDLLASGMGCRAAIGALREISRTARADTRPLGEVILVAPDVDSQVFGAVQQDLVKVSRRVTVYTSGTSLSLRVAKQVHGAPRAGEGVNPTPGLDVVDFSNVQSSDAFSAYMQVGETNLVLMDINGVLKGEPASTRYGLVTMTHGASSIYSIKR